METLTKKKHEKICSSDSINLVNFTEEYEAPKQFYKQNLIFKKTKTLITGIQLKNRGIIKFSYHQLIEHV